MDKKWVLQLLQDYSVEDTTGNSYEQRIIVDNDFDALAETILSKQEEKDLLLRECRDSLENWEIEGLGDAVIKRKITYLLDKLNRITNE